MTKKKRIYAVLVCVLFLSGLVLYFIFNQDTSKNESLIGSLDPSASERVLADDIEKPESIDIPGYPTTIPVTSDLGYAYIDLYNPDTNDAYFTFELVLGDTVEGQFEIAESLYQSDLVAPGFSIDEQKLSHTLDKGLHSGAILIKTYTYNPDTEVIVEMNGAQLAVELDVN